MFAAVDRLAAGHDLAVVAVGRGSIPALFPVDPARSPYGEPQRLVFAGLFDGLALPEPFGVSFNIALPGVGEDLPDAHGHRHRAGDQHLDRRCAGRAAS